MLAAAGLATALSVLLSWFVTFRLFALARRTGAKPERILATAFGSILCVGYPLSILSRAPFLSGSSLGRILFCAAMLAIALGIASFARFPLSVFRPTTAWAKALAAAIALLGFASVVGCIVAIAGSRDAAAASRAIQSSAIGLVISVAMSLTWNAAESFSYYVKMKRRLAIGLADVQTTHRFLLWGIASTTGVLQTIFVAAIRASGFVIIAPMPALIISLVSLIISLCWWIAFFMPQFYVARWLEPGSEAHAESA